MLVKLSIEVDSIDMLKAALLGLTGANAEETGPAVLSDQASSDIDQHQAEIPLESKPEGAPRFETYGQLRERLGPPTGTVDVFERVELPKPVAEPKKRGRKPRLAVVEDVEPPPEVIAQEDEAEAEGA